MSELEYRIQAKHHKPAARSIALEEETIEDTRFYVLNLRKEIAQYLIPIRPKSLIEAQHEVRNIKT